MNPLSKIRGSFFKYIERQGRYSRVNISLDKFFFHPRVAFPGTGERDLEWVEVSGNGVVYSTTCNRRLPEKGGDFNLSLITLDEGPRIMSRVEGIDPDKVEIGQKVKARISSLNGEPAVIFDVL